MDRKLDNPLTPPKSFIVRLDPPLLVYVPTQLSNVKINSHKRFLSCCTWTIPEHCLKWLGRSDCKVWPLPMCNYISHKVKCRLIETPLQDVSHFNIRRTWGWGLLLSHLCADVTTYRHRPRRSCWGLSWLSCWTLKHCTIGLCWQLCTWIAGKWLNEIFNMKISFGLLTI